MKNKYIKVLRILIGVLILGVVSVETYLHQVLGGGEAPSIHALCPYGALESVYTLFSTGTMIQKIFTGTFVLFVGTIVLGIIFRRSFCGVICPFGILQEISGKIGKMIFRRRFVIPEKIDKPLRFLKYLVLILTVVMAWSTASLWISPYDPWTAYSHITSSELLTEYLIGFIILIITIVGSILYDRFFCKYLCPMGAFLGIISKISPNKIVRNEDKCVKCNLCSKNCPMNIQVSKIKEVKSSECINCQECVLSCPAKGALESKEGNKSISPLKYIIMTIIIFFTIVIVAKAIGVYKDTPQKADKGSVKTIEAIDEDIKGYMTINDISEATGIEIEKIYKAAGFTKKQVPADTKCKEIAEKLGKDFETEDMRKIIKELTQ